MQLYNLINIEELFKNNNLVEAYDELHKNFYGVDSYIDSLFDDFITDEEVDLAIKEGWQGYANHEEVFYRLKNLQHTDYVYFIDGYGNLNNIDEGVILYLYNEVYTFLENNLEENELDFKKMIAICNVSDSYFVDVYNDYSSNESLGYLALTEEEADEKAANDIIELAWAFNSNFLSSITDIDEEVFKGLSKQYEDGNNAILKLIENTCGKEYFIDEAIKADGRGHFIACYDGVEHEEYIDGLVLYVYQV